MDPKVGIAPGRIHDRPARQPQAIVQRQDGVPVEGPEGTVLRIADRGALLERDPSPVLPVGHAGVQEHEVALAVYSHGSGPAAELPRGVVGYQGKRQVFPIHQIPAAGMAPEIRAERLGDVRQRIGLVEDVMPAPVKNRTVGVVHALGRRPEVEGRPAGIRLGAGDSQFQCVLGLAQEFSAMHVQSPDENPILRFMRSRKEPTRCQLQLVPAAMR